MFVIDKKNLKVIDVPDDYRECSMCLAWKPLSDFRRKGEDQVCRTNCFDCFRLPQDEFIKKKEEVVAYLDNLSKNGHNRLIMRTLEHECNIRKNGITKDALRAWFNELLKDIPDDAIIDHSGGDLEIAEAIVGKKLYEVRFSAYNDDY